MATTYNSSKINQTYTTMSGCDIQAFIENYSIGNIQGVSFSITREKAPVYVMGSSDPVSFSRGKRGIAGSLIFTNFDRAALYDITRGKDKINMQYYKKALDIAAGGRSFNVSDNSTIISSATEEANYTDQIPPFKIVLTGANELGASMWMSILGVELLNEGAGLSIDDIVNETQMTFVARHVVPWQPKRGNSDLSGIRAEAEASFSQTAAARSISKALDLQVNA